MKVITIKEQFETIKKENRIGLMTHVVYGYPDVATTRSMVNDMSNQGVDFIELQIPFSDPLGDGPTIRKANELSLKNGARVEGAFELVRKLRTEDKVTLPLLFMTYCNIVFQYGFEKFCKDAREVGITGLIIPDYNLEYESVDQLEKYAKENELVLVRFLSLDSDEERMKELADGAEGFIYCFSTRGVTGARESMDAYIEEHINRARKYFNVPLAVGFGVSKGEHVAGLKRFADCAVVGSAFLNAYNEGGLAAVHEKIGELVSNR